MSKKHQEIAKQEQQRREQRQRHLASMILKPSRMPPPVPLLKKNATELERGLHIEKESRYRHLVKCYFSGIKNAPTPTMPPALSFEQGHVLNFVKQQYQEAVEVYKRRCKQFDECQKAQVAFNDRRLKEPRKPTNALGSGMARYEAKHHRWKQKMQERGYEV